MASPNHGTQTVFTTAIGQSVKEEQLKKLVDANSQRQNRQH